ncbi:tyrosine-type recombinase/integrase [Enterobacter soli]
MLSSARKTRIPANITTHFASARSVTGLTRVNDPPSFHELRSLSARLHAKQRDDEFAQHLLGHKSWEMSEKYRDTRGSEWDIISS